MDVGACVGEMSIIEDRDPSAYVIGAEQSHLLVIHQSTLWEMVDASHEFAKNLLVVLSERVRSHNRVIADSFGELKKFERHATTDALTSLAKPPYDGRKLPVGNRTLHRKGKACLPDHDRRGQLQTVQRHVWPCRGRPRTFSRIEDSSFSVSTSRSTRSLWWRRICSSAARCRPENRQWPSATVFGLQ